MILGDESGKTTIKTTRAVSPAGHVSIVSADDGVQENIRTLTWTGEGKARFEVRGTPVDLSRQNTGDMAIYIRMRGEGSLNSAIKDGEWAEVAVKLSCFAEGSEMPFVRAPFVIETAGKAKLSLSDVRLVANEGQAVCLD